MLKKILKNLDLTSVGIEMRMYDIVHVVSFIVLIISSYLVNYFFDSKVFVYVTIGMACMFLLTMIEANRTGRFSSCAIVMSIIFNFFYMPIMLFYYGKNASTIALFFLFGIAYTGIILEREKAVALASVEVLFYAVCIWRYIAYNYFDYADISLDEKNNILLSLIFGVVIMSFFVGIIVRYRHLVYKEEEDRANEIRENALEEYISKDMFLTNMSHEIRTPMNAIVGNVNLILDETQDAKTIDNAFSILNSCDALISIVNELMDLSKTESREDDIKEVRFDLYELITEIINMISVRMMDDASEFYAKISKKLPRFAYGDASKIRQVIVWVLNTACRYLEEGSISLITECESARSGHTVLKCQIVCDGFPVTITPKELDDEQSIYSCLTILEKMGGSAVNKHEGKIATVYISIPVKVEEEMSLATSLDKINDACVLFIESRDGRKKAIKDAMSELLVNATEANTVEAALKYLDQNVYSHIFIASELYSENYDVLNAHLHDEKVITISDVGGNIENRGVYATIMRPINTLNIFSALADEDMHSVHRAVNKGNFELCDATILVVDDNFTNLSVASSLMKKYGATILTASSGLEAIRILSDRKVDLVFLDYMMPDLNGIDTLNMIRELDDDLNRNVPAIALSANVVSGAYEMFMRSGFNGFIPKPIDVVKLEKCFREFIPKEYIKYKKADI